MIRESQNCPDSFVSHRNGEDVIEWKAGVLTAAEVDEAFRLRYRYVVDERKWLKPDGSGIDRDEWDRDAIHFGCFHPEYGLTAYARANSGGINSMMLSREFRAIVPDFDALALRINPETS
ncbi:hypothetical protein KKC60_01035, partial [Patescibacteria group bacterium]|nr:hypothetical protein [Patescibacteria group bacterium]